MFEGPESGIYIEEDLGKAIKRLSIGRFVDPDTITVTLTRLEFSDLIVE